MKKVLIIGATSAIAQEVAKIYADEKSSMAIVARNTQMLDVIAQDLKVRGALSVESIALELNNFAEHENCIEKLHTQLGGFDVVLLAHGTLGSQEQANANPQHVVDLINTNFVSYASLLTSIAAKMKAQGHGTIAVISSVAGDRGKQSNFAYGSAQAGKSAFTDGLRNSLYHFGVHVVTLKLGFVDTPMTAAFKKGALWAKSAQIAAGIVSAIELKKDTVYLPFFWRYIMWIICSIPERLFKRLKM
jgi:short-subunit dehydrogenase